MYRVRCPACKRVWGCRFKAKAVLSCVGCGVRLRIPAIPLAIRVRRAFRYQSRN